MSPPGAASAQFHFLFQKEGRDGGAKSAIKSGLYRNFISTFRIHMHTHTHTHTHIYIYIYIYIYMHI